MDKDKSAEVRVQDDKQDESSSGCGSEKTGEIILPKEKERLNLGSSVGGSAGGTSVRKVAADGAITITEQKEHLQSDDELMVNVATATKVQAEEDGADTATSSSESTCQTLQGEVLDSKGEDTRSSDPNLFSYLGLVKNGAKAMQSQKIVVELFPSVSNDPGGEELSGQKGNFPTDSSGQSSILSSTETSDPVKVGMFSGSKDKSQPFDQIPGGSGGIGEDQSANKTSGNRPRFIKLNLDPSKETIICCPVALLLQHKDYVDVTLQEDHRDMYSIKCCKCFYEDSEPYAMLEHLYEAHQIQGDLNRLLNLNSQHLGCMSHPECVKIPGVPTLPEGLSDLDNGVIRFNSVGIPRRSFACRLCPLNFTTSRGLLAHHQYFTRNVLNKEGKDPCHSTFLCKVCPRQFEKFLDFYDHHKWMRVNKDLFAKEKKVNIMNDSGEVVASVSTTLRSDEKTSSSTKFVWGFEANLTHEKNVQGYSIQSFPKTVSGSTDSCADANELNTGADNAKNLSEIQYVESSVSYLPGKQEKEESKFGCGICLKTFPRLVQLQGHMGSHAKNKNPISTTTYIVPTVEEPKDIEYKCGICSEIFTKLSLLQNHMEGHCKSLKQKQLPAASPFQTDTGSFSETVTLISYACDVCNRTFLSELKLWDHRLNHGPEAANKNTVLPSKKTDVNRKKNHTCVVCKRSYYHKKSLNFHETKGPCKMKVPVFVAHQNAIQPITKLEKHTRASGETKGKVVTRRKDGVKNTRSSRLKARAEKNKEAVQSQDGQEPPPPHDCDGCDKTFNLLWQLQRHKGLRTKANKYQIPQGSEAAGTVIPEPPYSCNVCHQRFTCFWQLKCHKGKRHGQLSKWLALSGVKSLTIKMQTLSESAGSSQKGSGVSNNKACDNATDRKSVKANRLQRLLAACRRSKVKCYNTRAQKNKIPSKEPATTKMPIIPQYKCNVCSKSFERKASLRSHKISHNRKCKNKSQEAVSDLTDVSEKQMSSAETGEVCDDKRQESSCAPQRCEDSCSEKEGVASEIDDKHDQLDCNVAAVTGIEQETLMIVPDLEIDKSLPNSPEANKSHMNKSGDSEKDESHKAELEFSRKISSNDHEPQVSLEKIPSINNKTVSSLEVLNGEIQSQPLTQIVCDLIKNPNVAKNPSQKYILEKQHLASVSSPNTEPKLMETSQDEVSGSSILGNVHSNENPVEAVDSQNSLSNTSDDEIKHPPKNATDEENLSSVEVTSDKNNLQFSGENKMDFDLTGKDASGKHDIKPSEELPGDEMDSPSSENSLSEEASICPLEQGLSDNSGEKTLKTRVFDMTVPPTMESETSDKNVPHGLGITGTSVEIPLGNPHVVVEKVLDDSELKTETDFPGNEPNYLKVPLSNNSNNQCVEGSSNNSDSKPAEEGVNANPVAVSSETSNIMVIDGQSSVESTTTMTNPTSVTVILRRETDPSDLFTCKVCSKTYVKFNQLNAHKRCHERKRRRKKDPVKPKPKPIPPKKTDDGKFICDICGAIFSGFRSLYGHKGAHVSHKNTTGFQKHPITKIESFKEIQSHGVDAQDANRPTTELESSQEIQSHVVDAQEANCPTPELDSSQEIQSHVVDAQDANRPTKALESSQDVQSHVVDAQAANPPTTVLESSQEIQSHAVDAQDSIRPTTALESSKEIQSHVVDAQDANRPTTALEPSQEIQSHVVDANRPTTVLESSQEIQSIVVDAQVANRPTTSLESSQEIQSHAVDAQDSNHPTTVLESSQEIQSLVVDAQDANRPTTALEPSLDFQSHVVDAQVANRPTTALESSQEIQSIVVDTQDAVCPITELESSQEIQSIVVDAQDTSPHVLSLIDVPSDGITQNGHNYQEVSQQESKSLVTNPPANCLASVQEIKLQKAASKVAMVTSTSFRKLGKYSCEQCSKTFSRFTQLKSHLISHKVELAVAKREKPYFCKVCKIKFVTVSRLLFHMKRHGDEKECELLRQKIALQDTDHSYYKKNLDENATKKALGAKKKGKTKWSFVDFDSPEYLVLSCPYCSKKYAKQCHLSNHMNVHKHFKCTLCGLLFWTARNLSSHFSSHQESIRQNDESIKRNDESKIAQEPGIKPNTVPAYLSEKQTDSTPASGSVPLLACNQSGVILKKICRAFLSGLRHKKKGAVRRRSKWFQPNRSLQRAAMKYHQARLQKILGALRKAIIMEIEADTHKVVYDCTECRKSSFCHKAILRHFLEKHLPQTEEKEDKPKSPELGEERPSTHQRFRNCPICKGSSGFQCHLHNTTKDNDSKFISVDKKKVFSCDQCSQTFTQQKRLIKHQVSHKVYKDEAMIVCRFCKYTAVSRFAMAAHLKVHKKRHPQFFKANAKGIMQLGTVTKLVRDPHDGSKECYTCRTCGEFYHSVKAFRNHTLEHQAEARHKVRHKNNDTPNKSISSPSHQQLNTSNPILQEREDRRLTPQHGTNNNATNTSSMQCGIDSSPTTLQLEDNRTPNLQNGTQHADSTSPTSQHVDTSNSAKQNDVSSKRTRQLNTSNPILQERDSRNLTLQHGTNNNVTNTSNMRCRNDSNPTTLQLEDNRTPKLQNGDGSTQHADSTSQANTKHTLQNEGNNMTPRKKRKHTLFEQPGESLPVSCAQCTDTFKTADVLGDHIIKEHTFKNPYSCTKCAFTTDSPFSLQRHQKKHPETSLDKRKWHAYLKDVLHSNLRPSAGLQNSPTKMRNGSRGSRQSQSDMVSPYKMGKPEVQTKPGFTETVESPRPKSQTMKTVSQLPTGYDTPQNLEESSGMSADSPDEYFACSQCKDFHASTQKEWDQHIVMVHKGNNTDKLSCKMCQYTTSNKERLERHMKLHRRMTLQCDSCSYRTPQRHQMIRHVQTVHKQQKPFKCKTCSYSTAYNHHLRRHAEKHKNPNFRCRYRKFIKSGDWHMVDTIKGNAGVICKECGCELRNKKTLRRHQLKKHFRLTGAAPPGSMGPSSDVQRSFTVIQPQSGNIGRAVFSEKLPEAHQCPICAMVFRRRGDLNQHVAKGHPKSGTSLPSQCPQCGLVTGCGQLEDHMKIHEEENLLSCNEEGCQFKTAELVHLKRHQSKHAAQKEALNTCRPCQMTFPDPSSLEVHNQQHHSKLLYNISVRDPFLCSHCPYRSPCEKDANRHWKLHNYNLPFKCDYCVFSTSTAAAIATHRKIHSHGRRNSSTAFVAKRGSKNRKMRSPGSEGSPQSGKLGVPSLPQHVFMSTQGKKLYECRYCQRFFEVAEAWQRHELRHMAEWPQY